MIKTCRCRIKFLSTTGGTAFTSGGLRNVRENWYKGKRKCVELSPAHIEESVGKVRGCNVHYIVQ